VALHFAQCAAVYREILRVDLDGATVNLAIARDDAIAQKFFGRGAQLVALRRNEWFELVEGAAIQK
jgi:hypothetical protein